MTSSFGTLAFWVQFGRDVEPLDMDVSDPYANLVEAEVEEHDESSSESSSNDGGAATDEQTESTIRLLKKVVAATPNDYHSRVQLIAILRQQGDVAEAIDHREALASMFPLGESTFALNLLFCPFNRIFLTPKPSHLFPILVSRRLFARHLVGVAGG